MIPRITDLDRRYAASASLVSNGVELIAVQDALGARFDLATRDLVRVIQRDGPRIWDQLAGAVKALRWRLITDPIPIEQNRAVQDAVNDLKREVSHLQGAVDEPHLLSTIIHAASNLLTRDPPVARVIVECIQEVGSKNAIVVAANSRACEVLGKWLGLLGTRVLTFGDLERDEITEDITYFVGPPRFFKAAAVTAPRTSEVTFVVPGWFSDRTVPQSAISKYHYAEGGIKVAVRVTEVSDPNAIPLEEADPDPEPIPEDDLLPQPVWGSRPSGDRAPTAEEVEVRKVLLSGNRAIWLDDDGERIRIIDPTQPVGERVGYSKVSAVTPGIYLLLREGEAEREQLRSRAFDLIGSEAAAIKETQESWKSALSKKLEHGSVPDATNSLRGLGVQAAGQVHSWASPHVIRPQKDHDFKLLLDWLGFDVQPYFGHASKLRSAVHLATSELRSQLEDAANSMDVRQLLRKGHITLDMDESGLRGMFATKVLAVAPSTEWVARSDARVPFEDAGARWLE